MILEGEKINYQTNQGQIILKDAHIKVKTGQSVGIIGANGCGKTTLINCLTNLNQGCSGKITLLNKSLGDYTQQALAQKVSVMHQTNYFPFDFTVEEIVEMGRYPFKGNRLFLSKEDQSLIEQVLINLDLVNKRDAFYSKLSGGEKQRVILARALAQTPELLILDEPTNHLDMYQQRLILTLIQQMNLTTLSVLHDLNLAYEFCDIIYMLKKGEVVYFGETKSMMTEASIKEVFGIDVDIIESQKSGKKHLVMI